MAVTLGATFDERLLLVSVSAKEDFCIGESLSFVPRRRGKEIVAAFSFPFPWMCVRPSVLTIHPAAAERRERRPPG